VNLANETVCLSRRQGLFTRCRPHGSRGASGCAAPRVSGSAPSGSVPDMGSIVSRETAPCLRRSRTFDVEGTHDDARAGEGEGGMATLRDRRTSLTCRRHSRFRPYAAAQELV
jgi:hypothetical protein